MEKGEKMEKTINAVPKKVWKKAPKYRFAALIMMILCYILIYAGIQVVATCGADIMADLAVKEGALGVFSSIGNPCMAIMSIIAGFIVSKIGGKKVIIIGLLVLAVSGALYLTHPTSVGILVAIRMIQGFGTGMVSATEMALVSVWFPVRERGTSQAITAAFYGASTSIVTAYAGIMTARNFQWHQVIGYMLLVCGIVFAIIIALFYRDIEKYAGVHVIDEAIEGYVPQEEQPVVKSGEEKGNWKRPNNWHDTLRHPVFWILGISLFFYCGSAFGLGFCLPLFLTSIGFDGGQMAAVMTLGSLGTLVFGLFGGVMSDKIFKGKRCQVYFMAFAGGVILLLLMIFNRGNLSVGLFSVLYFIGIGFMNLSGGPAWALPTEVVGPAMAQQNNGTCLLFSGMGGTVMLMIFGFVAERFGGVACLAALAICAAIPAIFSVILGVKYKL